MSVKILWAFMAASWLTLISCGDNGQDIGNDVANATQVMGFEGEMVVEELGMTIRKLKVWKTRNNGKASGVSSVVSEHTVEMWYSLDNDGVSFSLQEEEEAAEEDTEAEEDDPTIRYANVAGMIADNDGNLFFERAEPGTVEYEAPSGLTTSLTDEGLLVYQREAENGLVSEKFPPNTIFNRNVGNNTTRVFLKAPEIGESPWASNYSYGFGGSTYLGGREYYESNEEFELTTEAGCLYQTGAGSGLKKHAYFFSKVQLGNIIQHTKNLDTAAAGDDDETLGDDDKLWVKWNEYWYLTGLNYKTKTLRVIRARVAPIYTGRELPGVDASNDSPSLSGYDALIRSCNKKAGSNGEFRMLSLGVGTPTTANFSLSLTVSSAQSYCSALASADANDNDTTDTSYGCGFNISPVTAGTWDGSAHSGPVSSPSGTLNHVEMSESISVSF